MRWLCGLLAFVFVGCGATSAAPTLVALLLLLSTLWFARTSGAGAPAPCTGYEETSCGDGIIVKHCCPAGAVCNFRSRPFVDCGNGYCAEGVSKANCIAPKPRLVHALGEKDCTPQGSWQSVCLNHKVQMACVIAVPSNFTGPPPNPAFRTASNGRCTTSPFIEEAFATRVEQPKCDGRWIKVCLGGAVTERCAPKEHKAADYVSCPSGGCARGADTSACE